MGEMIISNPHISYVSPAEKNKWWVVAWWGGGDRWRIGNKQRALLLLFCHVRSRHRQ